MARSGRRLQRTSVHLRDSPPAAWLRVTQGTATNTERESIWSVPKEAKTAYYRLFIGQFLLGVWVLWSRATAPSAGWEERLVDGWNDAAALAVACAASALIVSEIWREIMVLSSKQYENLKRTREARRQEGAGKALDELEKALPRDRRQMDLEEVKRIIEKTREIVQRGTK